MGLVVLAGVARAQPAMTPAATATQVARHEGFYLRLMLGGGYDEMTTTSDTKFYGTAIALDIHVGYFVVPNLAIGADLYGSGISGPTIAAGGMDTTTSTSAQLTFTSIGAGATYFVPGANAYASAGFGIARGQLSDGTGAMAVSPTGWGTQRRATPHSAAGSCSRRAIAVAERAPAAGWGYSGHRLPWRPRVQRRMSSRSAPADVSRDPKPSR
jgi:hypothetical protein